MYQVSPIASKAILLSLALAATMPAFKVHAEGMSYPSLVAAWGTRYTVSRNSEELQNSIDQSFYSLNNSYLPSLSIKFQPVLSNYTNPSFSLTPSLSWVLLDNQRDWNSRYTTKLFL
jgi:vacuolar-type H+-ATPase subunit C/Vma6